MSYVRTVLKTPTEFKKVVDSNGHFRYFKGNTPISKKRFNKSAGHFNKDTLKKLALKENKEKRGLSKKRTDNINKKELATNLPLNSISTMEYLLIKIEYRDRLYYIKVGHTEDGKTPKESFINQMSILIPESIKSFSSIDRITWKRKRRSEFESNKI